MQSSAIRPERSRLFAAVAGLLVLTGLMAFFPFACDWHCLRRFWAVPLQGPTGNGLHG